jgi:AP2-associated kinase
LKENEKPPTKTAAGYGRFTDLNSASQTKKFEDPSPVQSPKPSAIQREGEQGSKSISASSSAISAAQGAQRPAQRPTAPPKPQVLRTGQGIALPGGSATDGVQAGEAASPNDDWEANFSKRYPSLSGLELVETEIDSRQNVALRTREV